MLRLLFAVGLGCLLTGAASADTKNGSVKFTGVKQGSVNVKAGDKVKLDATLEQIDVGGISAVSVAGNVTNNTGAKMYYSYNVAFLDKDKNLVGCQNFELFLDGGKTMRAGTFIKLPPDQIAKIAYYSIAFHESDKPIGSP
jgi:hypothetical protein